ncbi:MAG: DMT family transporter [Pseudomonadota bacterium]
MDDKVDNNRLAVAVILLTVLALSFGDALIKNVSADLVLWQIFVLRSLLALPVLFLILRLRFSSVALIPSRLLWTSVRSAMLVVMWVAYYAALPHIPFSNAAAAYYTLPIFITLFSALFTGERVSRAGWAAIAMGFIGVVLILKPAADEFNRYALLPLVSAILFALAMILTRTKCRDEHPLVLSAALNIAFIVFGLVATGVLGQTSNDHASLAFLSPSWPTLSGDGILIIGVLTVAILIGSVGAAIAYQIGASSLVATFDFAYVGFAVIWGILFFSEIPDNTSIAGMVLIVAAGIIAVRR